MKQLARSNKSLRIGLEDPRLMASWKHSFTRRVTSSFLILALLTVSTVGSVAFWRAREALKKAAYDRLNVTATLKEQEIARWLESCERDFLMITRFPDVNRSLQLLLTTSTNVPDYVTARATLETYLQEVRELKPKFSEIFIIDRSNRILLSTDANREGQYEIATNLTYFETVIEGEDFTPVFYVSPVDGKPAVTYASPIRDRAGQRQGVILAHLNLQRIDQIVRESTGLGETGETYVVGSLAERTAFVSRQPQLAEKLPEEPHSQGINEAMQAISGQGLYQNYAGVPVVGVYRWLRGQDLALLVEMAQVEAFKPARQLALTIVLVGLGSAGILFLGVMRLAKQLSNSRRQLEEYSQRLEKTAEKAQAANRAKSEFLANMSHELRTPLNAILGFTQLLESDRTLQAQQHERVKIIGRSGEHLLALINDVLSMSKIEAGRANLTPKCFDLYELLLALEGMLRVKAKAKGLQFCVHRTSPVPRFIETDEGKLRQVLVNLLGNAVKFTEQGTVTLKVDVTGSSLQTDLLTLQFSVCDTGPGIATEEQSQLFDPFFQASRTQHTPQGTGLGLSISQRFVQLMGGKITVLSDLGQGAIFSFAIPVKLAEPIEAIKPPVIAELMPGQPNHRILIVDDDDYCRQLLTELLKAAGFTALQEASHGEEALQYWQCWQPQLIWMDMRMPVMDGYEVTRQIRTMEAERSRRRDGEKKRNEGKLGEKNVEFKTRNSKFKIQNSELKILSSSQFPRPIAPSPKRTNIIALTASAFEEERAAILACGCDDFVRKPLQMQEIFDKLAHYLGVIYRDRGADNKTEAVTVTPTATGCLQARDLHKMPQPWICRLHRAAIQVDADQIHLLINQIPGQHRALANELTHLTQTFDFDTLIELSEAAL